MSAAEAWRLTADEMDLIVTEFTESRNPYDFIPAMARIKAEAYRRALEDAAKDIDLSEFYDPDPRGQVSQECGHAETAAHRWLTARADAAPDPRETKD